jgi:hypothetical protein
MSSAAEVAHAIGNEGNTSNVSIIHINMTINPKIQIDRVKAIATWRLNGSGGAEGGRTEFVILSEM